MRHLVFFVFAEPVLAGIALLFSLVLYMFLYSFVEGSSRTGPGKKRITSQRRPVRLAAYSGLAGLAGCVTAYALYAYTLHPGTLSSVYRVEDRIVALFERTSRGVTDCIVRSTDLATGRIEGLSVLRSSCEISRPHGRRVWLRTPERFGGARPVRWYGVDLYSAEVTADASSLLNAYGSEQGAGEHRFLPSKGSVSVKAQLQSGEEVWVDSSGRISASPSPTPPSQLERLRLSLKRIDLEGVHRPQRVLGVCGCATGATACGELTVFSSVAFGEGSLSVGLARAGRLVWSTPLDDWGVESASAFASQGSRCMLVGTTTVRVPVIGPQGGARAIEFERESGAVVRELVL